ncbi:hypothetical protein GJ744_005904 [Endocarpon pusillum]|uniref:Signal recognition particle subunit SRP14 n=1 Tax=Endocarpon pusillum TaxID=364733 RepID=A0A8H7E530_9EURO|nr:hypothetical protein GJ744_005904 [Endocarpon pusillum]
MGTKHLSNDEFLTRLTTLLSTTHTSNHGSVFLTQKPLSPSSAAASSSIPSTSTSPPQILIRATNGKSKPHREKGEKEKLSTVVDLEGMDEFYRRYAEVCKKGMEGLRKRDRKARKRKDKDKGKKGGKVS